MTEDKEYISISFIKQRSSPRGMGENRKKKNKNNGAVFETTPQEKISEKNAREKESCAYFPHLERLNEKGKEVRCACF